MTKAKIIHKMYKNPSSSYVFPVYIVPRHSPENHAETLFTYQPKKVSFSVGFSVRKLCPTGLRLPKFLLKPLSGREVSAIL